MSKFVVSFVKEHYDDSSLIDYEDTQSSRDVQRIIERAGAISARSK